MSQRWYLWSFAVQGKLGNAVLPPKPICLREGSHRFYGVFAVFPPVLRFKTFCISQHGWGHGKERPNAVTSLFPSRSFICFLSLLSCFISVFHLMLVSTTRAGTKLKHCLRFSDLKLRVNPCTSHAARDCCLSALPLVGDICFPEASLGPAVGILGVRRTGLNGGFLHLSHNGNFFLAKWKW